MGGQASDLRLSRALLPQACRKDRPAWAQVAQLVEHATENRSVGGSIPLLGTISSRLMTRQIRPASVAAPDAHQRHAADRCGQLVLRPSQTWNVGARAGAQLSLKLCRPTLRPALICDRSRGARSSLRRPWPSSWLASGASSPAIIQRMAFACEART